MLQKNLSATMRAVRAARKQSITEFSEDLGIARSSLQDILSGTGNPRMDTVEYIAQQLGVDPIVLLSGSFDTQQLQTALLLIETIDAIAKLPEARRLQIADLFQQLIAAFTPDEPQEEDAT